MVHPTAIVSKEAVLGQNVSVGPYAVIEGPVQLGANVKVCAHACIKGNTEVGAETFVGIGAVLGEIPQIIGVKDNVGRLYIGKNNVIREYATIHTSSSPDKTTCIGNSNYLMGFSHIAHDCRLADNIVICNGALIAGHVDIQDKAFISGNAAVHQFVRIGRLAMIGGLARVNQDVPPFMMVVGDSKVWGLNLVGLKRAKVAPHNRALIKGAFNTIYRFRLPLKKALEEVREQQQCAEVQEISEFIGAAKRGICGPHRSTVVEKIFLDYPCLLLRRIQTYRLFLKIKNRKI